MFFRAENMEIASQMMQQINHNFKAHIILEFLVDYKTAIILIAIGYFLHFIPYKYEQWCQAASAKLHCSLQSLALLAMILLVVQFKFITMNKKGIISFFILDFIGFYIKLIRGCKSYSWNKYLN